MESYGWLSWRCFLQNPYYLLHEYFCIFATNPCRTFTPIIAKPSCACSSRKLDTIAHCQMPHEQHPSCHFHCRNLSAIDQSLCNQSIFLHSINLAALILPRSRHMKFVCILRSSARQEQYTCEKCSHAFSMSLFDVGCR